MIGTNAKTVSTDATLTGNGTSGSPLSVVAPGLSAVSTDTTLTGSGTVGSPLSVVDSSAGGSKLERVDTGAWEPARRSNGLVTAAADSTVDPGVKTTITSVGHEQTSGTVTISGTTDYNGDQIISNVTTDTFDIPVAYTSSQTGTWWADNEYVAPASFQLGGAFGSLKMRKFKGVTGGATVTLWATCGITKPPIVFGYLKDSATGDTMNVLGYISAGGIGAVQVASDNLTLEAGTSYDDAADVYEVMIGYYKP